MIGEGLGRNGALVRDPVLALLDRFGPRDLVTPVEVRGIRNWNEGRRLRGVDLGRWVTACCNKDVGLLKRGQHTVPVHSRWGTSCPIAIVERCRRWTGDLDRELGADGCDVGAIDVLRRGEHRLAVRNSSDRRIP